MRINYEKESEEIYCCAHKKALGAIKQQDGTKGTKTKTRHSVILLDAIDWLL